MTIKFALMGCGRIAKRHADILASSGIAGGKLVAVCDRRLDRASFIGHKYSVPYFSSIHELMSAVSVDVVVILTESGNHAENILEALKYTKNIIVEKPMALTLEDANLVINKCKENNCRLFVVKQNRFNLPVKKLRQALEAGRFGKLVLGSVRVRWCRTQEYYDQDPWRGTWRLDGGVLTNQASHHIDLLLWMMGEVRSVMAMSRTMLSNIETEDTATVLLNFKNNALGIIEATTAARPLDLEGSISILGEKGSVEVSGFAVNQMRIWNFVEPIPDDDGVMDKYSTNPPNVYGFGHHEFYLHVIDVINNDKSPMVDGNEGIKSLELINAIYASIELGREIYLNEFVKNSTKLGR